MPVGYLVDGRYDSVKVLGDTRVDPRVTPTHKGSSALSMSYKHGDLTP